eukprot:TRINITY_DN6775_c0_g1_i2.p4 TRINITY_DN6775_c0_g1~~TRINITY_DN6775_c0_g1_i2.p4  ORF type:complete len:127 (-),score=5.54 TRINITY_DN6775_c0_g1_i2:372-752(-)
MIAHESKIFLKGNCFIYSSSQNIARKIQFGPACFVNTYCMCMYVRWKFKKIVLLFSMYYQRYENQKVPSSMIYVSYDDCYVSVTSCLWVLHDQCSLQKWFTLLLLGSDDVVVNWLKQIQFSFVWSM